MQISKPGKAEIILLIGGLIAMLALIFYMNGPQLNDEIPYMANVAILYKYGLTNEYFINLKGSAGPLYSIVHYIFEPLTQLQPPGIRLVNVLFLIGTIGMLLLILKDAGYTHWSYALYLLAIPKIYVLSGLALTEMPAIFFFSVYLLCIVRAANVQYRFFIRTMYALAAGICISIAILGRQPFLLALAAVPVLFFRERNLKPVMLMLLCFITALPVPVHILLQWNGWMPPSDQVYYPDLPGPLNIRADFFILCVFYVAIVFIVLAPAIFRIGNRKEVITIIAGCIIAGVVNFWFELVRYLPVMHLLNSMPANLIRPAELLFGWLFICVSLIFVYKVLQAAIMNRDNIELLFFMASLLLICAASVKITWGFSSRYSAQTAPLMVLIAGFFYRRMKITPLLIGVAIVLGLSSLYFYYK